MILWLVEPTTFIGAGERHIAEQLSKIKTPVILVINKIDTVKSKEEILTFIAAYKDILNFAEIIPVSALKEMNIEDVKSSILNISRQVRSFTMRIPSPTSRCARSQRS